MTDHEIIKALCEILGCDYSDILERVTGMLEYREDIFNDIKELQDRLNRIELVARGEM